jgi:hypothetical protein
MQLQCNSCRQPIQSADVKIDLGIATRVVCNSVFSVLDKLASLSAGEVQCQEPAAPAWTW